jgi:hypothetical protein
MSGHSVTLKCVLSKYGVEVAGNWEGPKLYFKFDDEVPNSEQGRKFSTSRVTDEESERSAVG